jgi:DNA-directed RNA polymerase specialized sigma24 family protein
MRRIEAAEIASVRDYFRMAAREIRLELLDMARHYYGPLGHGRNLATPLKAGNGDSAQRLEAADSTYDPRKLSFWTEFHAQIDGFPEGEHAVFDLLWYHDMTQQEAAVVLEISLSSVKRLWHSARARLQPLLKQEGVFD